MALGYGRRAIGERRKESVVSGKFNTDARSDLTCIEPAGQLRISNARQSGSF
jgi:hypothetical protein